MPRWNPFLQRGAHPAPLEIPPVGLGPELATARLVLLNRLRQRGVPDRIVAAFAAIPRERFVPDDLRADSYEDRALPIGEEQTISQPYMIARMLVELALRPEDRVLDIGTGTGYQAALLGQLCREVVSIEVRPTLLERARRTLATLSAGNVTCHQGNGRLGWPARAPYDVIICAAASADVPQHLVDQLAPGGRIALPVGDRELQWLRVGQKDEAGAMTWRSLDACTFVPLVEEAPIA